MAHKTCRKRLQQELVALKRNPVEHIQALPHEKNILEWHYVIEGPKNSPYEGGVYHGVLRFPKEYPYKPPSILMFTRNGRFKTNSRLCLSMSDFHPEQWNPIWSVSSILSGLLSFMLDSEPTLGSIETTTEQKKAFAAKSLDENVRNKQFCALFPEYVEKYQLLRKAREETQPAGTQCGENSGTLKSDGDLPKTSASSGQIAERDQNQQGASGFSWSMLLAGVLAIAFAYLMTRQEEKKG